MFCEYYMLSRKNPALFQKPLNFRVLCNSIRHFFDRPRILYQSAFIWILQSCDTIDSSHRLRLKRPAPHFVVGRDRGARSTVARHQESSPAPFRLFPGGAPDAAGIFRVVGKRGNTVTLLNPPRLRKGGPRPEKQKSRARERKRAIRLLGPRADRRGRAIFARLKKLNLFFIRAVKVILARPNPLDGSP
jgi:hypothetical protein